MRAWSNRSQRNLLGVTAALLVLLLAGCTGLSDEPKTVATLVQPTKAPATPTAVSTAAVTNAATTQATQSAQATAQGTQSAAVPTFLPPVAGSINGQVTNKTAGGKVPAGLVVTLHVLEHTGNESTSTQTIKEDGKFEFKDVPISEDRGYAVTAEYQGQTFTSEIQLGKADTKVYSLPLQLYEVTADPAVITVTSVITRVNGAEGGLEVAQVIRLKNTSDRLFATTQALGNKRMATISFALPKGAVLVGSPDENRFVAAPDGSTLYDTEPVLPNADHSAHYIFRLPYSEAGTLLDLPSNYKIEGQVQLRVGPESLSINAPQLDYNGIQSANGIAYKAFSKTLTLKSSENLRYTIAGKIVLPEVAAAAPEATAFISGRELLIGLLVGGGIGLIIIGILLVTRDRLRGQNAEPTGAWKVRYQARIDRLVGELAKLDESHEQGQIGQAEYAKRRKELKDRLAALMK